jgi:hypothetical protein
MTAKTALWFLLFGFILHGIGHSPTLEDMHTPQTVAHQRNLRLALRRAVPRRIVRDRPAAGVRRGLGNLGCLVCRQPSLAAAETSGAAAEASAEAAATYAVLTGRSTAS